MTGYEFTIIMTIIAANIALTTAVVVGFLLNIKERGAGDGTVAAGILFAFTLVAAAVFTVGPTLDHLT